jgi:hypothetical protein
MYKVILDWIAFGCAKKPEQDGKEVNKERMARAAWSYRG